MATTSNTYTGNGTNKLFSITFPYLDTSDINVYLNGVLQTITTQYTFANATTIEFVTAPANGAVVLLDRSTDDTNLEATFFPGSSIKAADLNDNFDQTLYVVQEINNKAVQTDDPLYANKTYIDAQDATKVNKSGDTMSGNLAMAGNMVTGLGTTFNANDAATKTYVDNNAILYSGSPAFTQDGAGAVTRSWSSKLKDVLNVKDFGAVGDGVTDDTAAIQAAIDAAYLAGGGVVNFPEGTFLVSATLFVPQRVTLVGSGCGFVNQYSSGFAAPKGTVLFLKTGSNVSVVRFRCRLTNNAGILEETTIGGRNTDVRHFGGMRGITVWGNRSTNQSPAVRDLNTAGFGVIIEGSRYVRIEDTVIMYCAESGLNQISFDYGTGAISANNTQLTRVTSLSNYGDGFRLFGGDCIFSNLNAGYNGGNGIVSSCSGTMVGGLSWNNLANGFLATGSINTFSGVVSGLHSYDNNECGFRLGGGRVPSLSGCVARGNGHDTTVSALQRSNYLVTDSAEGWNLPGCSSYGRYQDGTLVTQYGFYIDNVNYFGTIDGTSDELSATPYLISNNTRIISHGSVTTTIPHPPIKLLGQIDMDGNRLSNTGALNFNAWATITSVTSGAITVGTSSLIALNLGAPTNITDLTFSGTSGLPTVIVRNLTANAVTFVHDATKLRLANATNAVLNINEAIMFVYVSGTVWQQVGGAF